MVRTSRKIPIRWKDYHPIGTMIDGTRMFPFKTPLKFDLQKQIFKEKRFTTFDLIRGLAIKGHALGLVINVSNTRRYYEKEDFEEMLIEHKELLSPGRGLLIRADLVDNFINIIDEFMLRNKDNDLLIGVHCSNGVDRTGYLICNYLICKLGWSSHQALNVFENARGHPIERGSYIQALHKADSDRRLKISNYITEETSEKKFIQKSDGNNFIGENDSFRIGSHGSTEMLQQFFDIEQQFKEVVNSTFMRPQTMEFKSVSVHNIPKVSETNQECSSSNLLQTTQEEADFDNMSAEFASTDDEALDGSSPNIDFECMGKIDIKEPASKSQQRRMRRQRREKMFSIMKRGRFWEINEMRKQMGK